MTNIEIIVNKARKYYFEEWRGHEEICPAFGEKVFLTKIGWNHIAKHPRRKLVDKIIRLKKLPRARELLKKSTTYQSLQRIGKYYYYGFQAIEGNTRIKVIVTSKSRTGKKYLYSVMFKNIERSEQKKTDKHNQKLIQEFRKKHKPRKRRLRS